ncbi:MAG: choice-of-anchor D domain-containing protein [Acidobacteriia bacterium]|nr:choice-of-anchor D domain-containing protein [Terriglobia bacterium]
MKRYKFLTFMRLATMGVAVLLAGSQGLRAQAPDANDPLRPTPGRMRGTTNAQRAAAAARARAAKQKANAPGMTATALIAPPVGMNPGGMPDYFSTTVGNWAYTPIIPKFVDGLPGLGPGNANLLGQYLPVAVADGATFANSDYYEIALVEYAEQMNSGLPPTRLRGYVQVETPAQYPSPTRVALTYIDGVTPILDLNGAPVFAVDKPHYLGPVIVAQRDRAVRIKFTNYLPATPGGNLPIPVDPSYLGAGLGPDGINSYTQNRATLHLHGGVPPWYSDGTPHTWTVPASEFPLTPYKRGLSARNVPDMWYDSTSGNVGNLIASCAGAATCAVSGAVQDPGPGSLTFYWTNQQSGRFMFYHDHAYGITRLNVYAGEAAGYLIQDPVEQGLVASGVIPTDQIPLVIQDRTWVDAANIANQDPTWNWGTTVPTPHTGDLWFPHVYLTNQNPSDMFGANGIGRWDYGLWFWPVMLNSQLVHGEISNPYADQPGENPTVPGMGAMPSGVPEGFMDTPIVNGTAYPTVTLQPKPYRLRILNACNDRTLNLQLYVADPLNAKEVKMVNAAPHPLVNPELPPDADDIPPCAAGVTVGLPNYVTGTVTNPATGCWPETWPTDGRDGGVPDPLTVGPSWIMIGTEGGLLPQPAVVDQTPIGYEYNRRSITVLNVFYKSLFLMGAQRADVVVDFSQYAGKTLILYNDAPAPTPAFDSRLDYYTGDVDQSMGVTGNGTGGAATTLPGFGPNTRTIMQIVVSGTPAPNPNLMANLNTNLPAAFAASQPPPVIPEPAFNAAYGMSLTAGTYSRISDTTIAYSPMVPTPQSVASFTITDPGAGYTAPAGVTITPAVGDTTGTGATASAFMNAGQVASIQVQNGGSGYTLTPTVVIDPPTCTPFPTSICKQATATALLGHPMLPKAIQELFENNYGRMNATLGTELPLTNFNTQTTIPLAYIDPPTEIIRSGDTQIWKITHNGVDTHGVHFHLFNVQLINRVGWDGQVKPPLPQEVGWLDTVTMNPLEDVIVALQPATPTFPFPIADSVRPLDVTSGPGTTGQFTGVDPYTNNPITVTNDTINFGWEYVWHCHILGHEENDFMRSIVFQVPPPAPSNLQAVWGTGEIDTSWIDNSANETHFELQSSADGLFLTPTSFIVLPSSPNTKYGGTILYPDSPGAAGNWYRVRAYNDQAFNGYGQPLSTLYSAWSTAVQVGPPPIAGIDLTALAFGNQLVKTTSAPQVVTLSNTGGSPLVIASLLFKGTNPGDFAQTNTCGGSVAAAGSCTISVTFTPAASGARSATLAIATNDPVNPTLNVTLTGTGIAPVASAAPAVVAFGNQLLNSPSAPATVTLTNTGNANLTINTIAVTGANAADFGQLNTCGTLPATLLPATNCTFSITFTPSALGARSASLAIGSSDPVTPLLNVPLTGTGVMPIAGALPPALTFPIQLISTTSAAQNVTLSNSGTGPLAISSIAITGANAGDFAQSNACGATLAAGANCLISVTYTPTVVGAETATLTVTDNSNAIPGSTQSVSLSGTGTGVSLSSTLLDFGAQPLGSTSGQLGVNLLNVASTPLAITSVALTGAFPGDFILNNQCGASLAAHTSCRINVRFRPTAIGVRTAAVTIIDADPTSPQTVSLTGTGILGVASVAPLALTFSSPMNVTTPAQVVTLTNVGTAPFTINNITLGGTNANQFARVNGCPASLGVGASCNINVTFTPTVASPLTKNATLNVNLNPPAVSQTVTLTGTIIVPTYTLSSTSLAFGNQARNTTSAPQVVTVTNTGTVAALGITSITLSGSNAGQFARTTTCGATLAAGATCTISVTFTPTSVGAKSAQVNFTVRAPATSQVITLSGTGI